MATADYEEILTGKEGHSSKFKTTLLDTDGTTLPASDIVTLTATLVSLDDRDVNGEPTVINSRSNVNVKNANGATIDEAGLFQWTLGAADMAMLNEARSIERHLLLLKVTYNGGSDNGNLKFLILVSNMEMT